MSRPPLAGRLGADPAVACPGASDSAGVAAREGANVDASGDADRDRVSGDGDLR